MAITPEMRALQRKFHRAIEKLAHQHGAGPCEFHLHTNMDCYWSFIPNFPTTAHAREFKEQVESWEVEVSEPLLANGPRRLTALRIRVPLHLLHPPGETAGDMYASQWKFFPP